MADPASVYGVPAPPPLCLSFFLLSIETVCLFLLVIRCVWDTSPSLLHRGGEGHSWFGQGPHQRPCCNTCVLLGYESLTVTPECLEILLPLADGGPLGARDLRYRI